MAMYRTIYSKGSNASSWYNRNPLSRKQALEKCQCMRLQYRYHWGWFKKVVGFILVLISISILVWNEKRAVESSRCYHHGMRAITIVSGPDSILLENNGKLVHVSGYLRVSEPLEDHPYGVSINAVKLKRRVQMYQWVEESVSSGAINAQIVGSSLKYRKIWKDKLSDSSKFEIPSGHENPKVLPVQSEIRVHPDVYVGNYKLGSELKDKFNSFVQFTSGERPEVQDIKMHMDLYFHSSDIWNPSVGDVRIQFSFAGPTNTYVSIIAMQIGQELRPFPTETGAQIVILHEGKKNHVDMFDKEHSSMAMESWMYRSAAYVVAICGTHMASRIIAYINRRNTVVRNLMSMGPRKFSMVTAAFICLSIAGIIWSSHTPIFGFLSVTFSCSLVLYYATGPDIPKRISLPQYSHMVY